MNSVLQTRSNGPCRSVGISSLGAVSWPHTRDFLDTASVLFADFSSLPRGCRLRITGERSLYRETFPVITLRAGLSFVPVRKTDIRSLSVCSAGLN